jgi:hypothetical protein
MNNILSSGKVNFSKNIFGSCPGYRSQKAHFR